MVSSRRVNRVVRFFRHSLRLGEALSVWLGGCCSTSVGASISIGCSDVVGSCCVGVGNVDGVYAGSFWLPIVVFFLLAFFDGLSSLVS